MRPTWITAAACAAVLSGCSVSGEFGYRPAVPVGTELVVHERLPLEHGDARVFVQGGEVIAASDVNRYEVACFISLRRRGAASLDEAVEPGQFLVIEGSTSWSRRRGSNDREDFIDPPTRLNYFTEMEIRSDQQPQVDELHCRYRGYRTMDAAPGPADIREAFGGLGTLTSPNGQE